MVAERETQQVAVQKMVMRKKAVTVMQPQTAYRTVPIGSSMAYAGYLGSSQMAFGYPILGTATQSVQRPTPDPVGGGASRTATKENFEEDAKPYERSKSPAPADGASYEAPFEKDEPATFPPSARRESGKEVTPAARRRSTSIAAADEASGGKSSGWRATRKSSELSLSQSNLTKPSISMADSVRER